MVLDMAGNGGCFLTGMHLHQQVSPLTARPLLPTPLTANNEGKGMVSGRKGEEVTGW